MWTIFVSKPRLQSSLPTDVRAPSHRAGRLHAGVGLGEGLVENQIGLVRERFFTPRLRLKSCDKLNSMLLDRCVAYAKGAISTRADRTVWAMVEDERPHLVHHVSRLDGLYALLASDSKVCPICFDTQH